MDLSKFKTSDWLKVGGALVFLIFGFVSWTTVDIDTGFGSASDSGNNVFDFFFTGTIPWILIIGTGVITVLLVMDVLKSKLPWPLITFVATALGAVLLLIRLIFNPLDEADAVEAFGGEVGRGVGLIVSAIAGVVAAVGGFLGFQEAGGSLDDLKDMNKIKSQFGGGNTGGGTPPPPPPPPGMSPPPPPPPA